MSVTIRDVAKAAGVSKTTAAYILNNSPRLQVTDETRRRVHDAARALDYRRNALAAALSSGRINTFGVFLPESLSSSEAARLHVYHKDMLTAIIGAASRAGVRIMPLLVHAGRTLDEKEIADQRVDGLLVTYPSSPETFAALQRASLPCVYLSSGPEPHVVQADDAGGMALAVDHLAELGHRRIVHYAPVGGSTANGRRRAGFSVAVARHGLTECRYAGSKQAVVELLRLPADERPTAFTTYSDQWAFHVLDIAREVGLRVPEDLSVVGFDDGPIAALARPQLTAVRNPLDGIADAAVALLAELVSGDPNPVPPPPVPTVLTVRASTAPPPPERADP
jgi:LacI family transcriptional regulator